MVNNLNNYVEVFANVFFQDYSHDPSGTQVDTKAYTTITSGITLANAESEALYDLGLSTLLNKISGLGEAGAFEGSATNESQIIAHFDIKAGETFSFKFLTDLLLKAKEIDNDDIEYNQAELNVRFLLIDSFGNIIDHANLEATLISSEQIGDLKTKFSGNFTLNDQQESFDIDGDNNSDYISSTTEGTYERTFKKDTSLTLIKVHNTAAYWLGDSLIGNLDSDVIYGSIWNDFLLGTQQDDNFYGSFGDDILFGWNGDDFFEGGKGDDWLYGGKGDDTLLAENDNDWLHGEHGDDVLLAGDGDDILQGGKGDDILEGGNGDDVLQGGKGNDILTGNLGADQFVYKTFRVFDTSKIGIDIITDFEVDIDKIVLSQRTFTALTNTKDSLISTDEFEVVANDELAAVSEAFITYSMGTGNLFYNQNGSDDGLGLGGQFVSLENVPSLTATDFHIIN